MKCDQCSWSRVNGGFVHERGCPNERKSWTGDRWARLIECGSCGEEYWDDDEHYCEDVYICHGCGAQNIHPIDHVCPEEEHTEQGSMEAEAEMELVMNLPGTAGIRCTFHKAAPAVKALPGNVNLCIACCEHHSQALVAGLRPDVGTTQMYQEWERD